MAFAAVTLLPVIVLAGVLLARSAALERDQLEGRLRQVANNLADTLDRDIEQQITILNTLAVLPSLENADWPMFYTAAKAAVGKGRYVILVEASSLRQVVNTYVPFGEAPPLTGDPGSVRRIVASNSPVISDLFVSLVTKRPVYNVSIPVSVSGATYALSLGQLTDDLLGLLNAQTLGPDWITELTDRRGVVLARSRHHETYSGKPHPRFAEDANASGQTIERTRSLEGEDVLRTVVRSRATGWYVTVSVPLAMAEAPLRRTFWLWGAITLAALSLALAGAWLFGRFMAAPMAAATAAAASLAEEKPIEPLRSRLTEANDIVAAQQRASGELRKRAEQQDRLLHELSHRVKNILAVVQSLVGRTLSGERPLKEAREVLTDRLLALGRAHEALMRTEWKGAPLKAIVGVELEPFADRASAEGPDVLVHGHMVQTLALVLHELATNAVKHGSLSRDGGRVTVHWSVKHASPARLTFKWVEKGGPAARPPDKKGFGTSLLEGAISSDLGIKPRLSFGEEGFAYEFDVALEVIGAQV
jgi:two-component sensor histidine kinase